MKRFLVVQLADIGDLVLSTPALAALRETHPDAQIALLTTAHAAPILAQLNRVRARAISRIILERSKLPGDQRLQNLKL